MLAAGLYKIAISRKPSPWYILIILPRTHDSTALPIKISRNNHQKMKSLKILISSLRQAKKLVIPLQKEGGKNGLDRSLARKY